MPNTSAAPRQAEASGGRLGRPVLTRFGHGRAGRVYRIENIQSHVYDSATKESLTEGLEKAGFPA